MDFSKLDGLIPAVVQDASSSEVLMVGFMNQAALDRTRESGFATFFSRTRGKLWMKGETSGNTLAVQQILVDCDDDTVLLRVTRNGDGNVCHTGERSCFYRTLENERSQKSEVRSQKTEVRRKLEGRGPWAVTRRETRIPHSLGQGQARTCAPARERRVA